MRGQLRDQGDEVGEHNEVTPHLARSARHPLPEGEGCISDSGCPHYGIALLRISRNMPGISKTARLFIAAALLR